MPAEVITTTVNPKGWGRWSCCYQMHMRVTDAEQSVALLSVRMGAEPLIDGFCR